MLIEHHHVETGESAFESGPSDLTGDVTGQVFDQETATEEGPTPFSESDAALLDAFAVPSYLSLFSVRAEKLLLIGEAGRLVHLGCRTGHPDVSWIERMPRTMGVGVDPNPAFIQVASSRLDALGMRYLVGNPFESGLDAQSFSHALVFHPAGGMRERLLLFKEMARLLYAGGQALVALPIAGSYEELFDLVREFALKNGRADLESAVDGAALHCPTAAQLSRELESVGLSDIGMECERVTLSFDSGLAFTTDPAARLIILPQLASYLDLKVLEPALVEYFVRAIDKYWSDSQFELSVEVAAVTARR